MNNEEINKINQQNNQSPQIQMNVNLKVKKGLLNKIFSVLLLIIFALPWFKMEGCGVNYSLNGFDVVTMKGEMFTAPFKKSDDNLISNSMSKEEKGIMIRLGIWYFFIIVTSILSFLIFVISYSGFKEHLITKYAIANTISFLIIMIIISKIPSEMIKSAIGVYLGLIISIILIFTSWIEKNLMNIKYDLNPESQKLNAIFEKPNLYFLIFAFCYAFFFGFLSFF